ncbi:MAG TPA: hypothetical protein VGM39_04885 [Kofleriaceae bacterium]
MKTAVVGVMLTRATTAAASGREVSDERTLVWKDGAWKLTDVGVGAGTGPM